MEQNLQKIVKSRKKYKSNFLENLYSMLEYNSHPNIICWSNDGTYFKILDPKSFSDLVLPKYYKHNNLSSFIRQLSFYNFRKTYQEYDVCTMCHMHPLFQRGRHDLLEKIHRSGQESKQTPEVIELSDADPEIEERFEVEKKKLRKVPDPKPIESEKSTTPDKNLIDSFSSEMIQMKKKARLFLQDFIPGLSQQSNPITASNTTPQKESSSANLYTEYLAFSKKVKNFLEFDKIDKLYEKKN